MDAQPFKAQQKIYYNIFKVEEVVMKVDIFKKLENTEIWEFRTLYNGICYRLFSAHPTNPVEGCADANPKTMLPNDT